MKEILEIAEKEGYGIPCINTPNEETVVELFKFLYSLIDNKKAIEKIISAKESKDIYEILMEEIR